MLPTPGEATTVLDMLPTSTLTPRSGDRRAGVAAEALAEHLGASVATVSSPQSPQGDTPATVLCTSAGLDVANDPTVSEALSHPGHSVLVIGPHCSSKIMLDGPMVVAFDGSRPAMSVFPTARAWAHDLDVPIVLAHMWTPLDAFDRGSEIFKAVRKALATLGPSARFEPVRTSYPAGGIRELAHELDASLVAMSSLGADAQPGKVIGHVAARVVRESSCPVLLHRPIENRSD